MPTPKTQQEAERELRMRFREYIVSSYKSIIKKKGKCTLGWDTRSADELGKLSDFEYVKAYQRYQVRAEWKAYKSAYEAATLAERERQLHIPSDDLVKFAKRQAISAFCAELDKKIDWHMITSDMQDGESGSILKKDYQALKSRYGVGL